MVNANKKRSFFMIKKIIFFILLFLSHYFHCRFIDFNIENLTLDQKIGQLFMVAAVADEKIGKDCIKSKSYRMDKKYIEELITTYHIGGIVFLGRSNVEKQIERTHYFQSISAIPLLIGQDLEPGQPGSYRLPNVFKFPSNQHLGDSNDLHKTYCIAFDIGMLCKKLGVHINFAPVVDINSISEKSVMHSRSFSNQSTIVAAHAVVFAQGLHDAGILACAKHFPGHGDANIDSHKDLPLILHDKKTLEKKELYPFKQLILNNIPTIMIGHLVVPALDSLNVPATLSKTIVTDVLQKELGFTGLIITDALDMGALTKKRSPKGLIELQALIAGNDILLCSTNVPVAIQIIKQAIADNIITEQEINAHVEKILRVKENIFKNME